MESIQINTGEISLTINGDTNRVIRFNPSDVLFAEKFYKMLGEAEKKSIEYRNKVEEINADSDILPDKLIDFVCEACDEIRLMIDGVFGAGTSQIAFGDIQNPDMFWEFLYGVAPYFTNARAEKTEPYKPATYTTPATNKRGKPKSQKPARGKRSRRK